MTSRRQLLALDVDGTLTDGIIGHTPDQEFRHFWVRDGIALVNCHTNLDRAPEGLQLAFIGAALNRIIRMSLHLAAHHDVDLDDELEW